MKGFDMDGSEPTLMVKPPQISRPAGLSAAAETGLVQ
jgi:hypothetical protein